MSDRARDYALRAISKTLNSNELAVDTLTDEIAKFAASETARADAAESALCAKDEELKRVDSFLVTERNNHQVSIMEWEASEERNRELKKLAMDNQGAFYRLLEMVVVDSDAGRIVEARHKANFAALSQKPANVPISDETRGSNRVTNEGESESV